MLGGNENENCSGPKEGSITGEICYYMDDVNMPKEMHGRVAYLGSSRNYLGRIIVRGLRYLRERRLMEDFRNWNQDQGPC